MGNTPVSSLPRARSHREKMRLAAAQSWQGLLPRSEAVLLDGMRHGLHHGAQLAVTFAGRLATLTIGDVSPGKPLRPDHILNWSSTTKAVLAVAVAQCRDRGLLDVHDAVAKHLPEFANCGKDHVTIAHCLTHTSGLWEHSFGPAVTDETPLDAAVRHVCASKLAERGKWPVGKRCAYDSPAFQVLGAVVERCDPQHRPFSQYVCEDIFQPLQMPSCRVGMTSAEFEDFVDSDRFAMLYNTASSQQRSSQQPPAWKLVQESKCAACVCDPSGNGRGPAEEFVLFFDALANDGASSVLGGHGSAPNSAANPFVSDDAPRILSPGMVVEWFATIWREGMVDELQGADMPWSLGFAVNSVLSGHHGSPTAFGHAGSQSSYGFADPEFGVAVVCLCNGKPGPQEHYRRAQAVADAVYTDLGLVV